MRCLNTKIGNLYYIGNYYSDKDIRKTCHLVKKGDEVTIKALGRILKPFVKGRNVIPIPSSSGRAELNSKILRYADANVYDVLEGKERISFYQLKKDGYVPNKDYFGFNQTEQVPEIAFLFDVVCASGMTLEYAKKCLSEEVDLLVYALDEKAFLKCQALKFN